MSDESRIQEMRRRLQAQVAERSSAGLSARLDCDPRVADPRGQIRVSARIYSVRDARTDLTPVIRCSQVSSFAERLLTRKTGGGVEGSDDYEGSFRASQLGIGKFQLTLHTSSDSQPIAACTVRILEGPSIDAVKEGISALASPHRLMNREMSFFGRVLNRIISTFRGT
jgi:hypothetical protein